MKNKIWYDNWHVEIANGKYTFDLPNGLVTHVEFLEHQANAEKMKTLFSYAESALFTVTELEREVKVLRERLKKYEK